MAMLGNFSQFLSSHCSSFISCRIKKNFGTHSLTTLKIYILYLRNLSKYVMQFYREMNFILLHFLVWHTQSKWENKQLHLNHKEKAKML